MSFDQLMQSFASQHNMEELDFRDNKYHLVLDEMVEVTCFQANGYCYLHGILAPLPDGARGQEELLVRLLKLNLSLINSQRVSLCIEPDAKHLGLYLMRSLQGFDEQELENALIEYITCFEILKQEVDQSGPQVASMPMMLMP